MDWEKLVEQIPTIIKRVREDYILNNMIIRDDIFGILEKHCTVVYYPMENEINCGFHTKRFVKNKLEDFVYINTAKTVAEQVFTAAHELGHVWGVATQVCELVGEQGKLDSQVEERIINRFAAELLMPTNEFQKTFSAHIKELNLDIHKLRFADLIRVIVLQMNDYMVPYESVRRRLVETKIITQKLGDILLENEEDILILVDAFLKEQNTMLDRVTAKKTVSGLRNLLEIVEQNGEISIYTIKKIKRDFEIDDISKVDDIVEISIEGEKYGEN
ncbi:MAG: ImmA/IrrE family metallo-endopeptidase [Clostridiales bacterium]|nr:ImmA/IrrE family metallo-endopeptidase [Clostridiales bacterium]